MLLTILAEKPHQLIVARDSSGRVIREDLLESYKANRAAMPDDFRDQVRACKLICEEL
jgi:5'-3' exonuclease